MNSSIWRGRSRVVAYLDLTIGALALVSGILLATFVATGKMNTNVFHDDPKIIANTNCLSVSLLVVTVLAIALQLYAAFQLLNGTESDADNQTALLKTRLWRNCSIFFIVIIAAADFVLFGMMAMIMDVALRMSMMIIVFLFIRELETLPVEKHFVHPAFYV